MNFVESTLFIILILTQRKNKQWEHFISQTINHNFGEDVSEFDLPFVLSLIAGEILRAELLESEEAFG